MNKRLITLVSTALLTLPTAIFAIVNPTVPNTLVGFSVIGLINTILSFIWPVFIGFAVIMFIIAAFKFIAAQGEATAVTEARQFVIWGVVGVTVGVLAFTLPYVVSNAFGF